MTGPTDAPGPAAERLACGVDPEGLLTQVAEGRGAERDAHQQRCPHCQATLAEYARVWAGVDELAASAVHAPPGLLDRALAAVRDRSGPSGYGRVRDEQDSFLVSARAVVAVAGHAARASAGVRMALGALGELIDPAGVDAGMSGQSVAIEIAVAAEYGHDLPRLAEHLRARVAAEVHAQTGLEVVVVDVVVTDVFRRLDPPPGPTAA